jgi:hypothetical protein
MYGSTHGRACMIYGTRLIGRMKENIGLETHKTRELRKK